MGKITAFTFITLNGMMSGKDEDLSWHAHGGEANEVAIDGLASGNTLLFGRKTFAMMASYWQSPMAFQHNADVANGMNQAEKIVFSTKLKKATWQNTTLIQSDIVNEMKKRKRGKKNYTLLGSHQILNLFAQHQLIDDFMILLDPVVIASGKPIFKNLVLNLQLNDVKKLKNGSVLLHYSPKK